ncbi:MAG: glycosyltransferase family 4 protein [Actinobacteria bacterium]|jgi:phosphatidylinositol alpha-1,6-mannosyltransferase|nr:glycosyltransferase family 4 protein [Actinomycetota bacterium]MDA8182961.1 glycosyltransferase family 4 protein [Actinomycetota bacterium]
MAHLLVTNDFPPKVGGIQAYLWELWSRLDPSSFAVLSASSDPGASGFDERAAQRGVRIRRLGAKVLLPTPEVAREVRSFAAETGATLAVLDPALPLGALGPFLGFPYAVVLHGAEVTVPARLPVSRALLARVLRGARLAICAGGYPALEAARAAGDGMPDAVVVPPGVDTARFRPLAARSRPGAREALGLPAEGPLVVSVSRLVPRKGMDVLIRAVGALQTSFPGLTLAIGGEGRDRRRLESLASRLAVPAAFLGRVPDADLPALYGSADVFAMACRDRWGGLEQEGFGIVFLEAAACGVPQVAGRSGGAAEAVVDGETGIVLDDPRSPGGVATALRRLLADDDLRYRLGEAGRRRCVESFGYDLLARRLSAAIQKVEV